MRNVCTLPSLAAVLGPIVGVPVHAEGDPDKPKRLLSPWFVYQGDKSIDALKPNADILDSISVCGGAPKAFVDQCHELGIEVYLLVGGHDGAAFDTTEGRQELVQSYSTSAELLAVTVSTWTSRTLRIVTRRATPLCCERRRRRSMRPESASPRVSASS